MRLPFSAAGPSRLHQPVLPATGGSRRSPATQGEVTRIFTLSATGQKLFFQYVFTDDAKVNDTVHYRAGISSSRTRRMSMGMFSAGNQALGVQVDFNPAAGQQFA